MVKPVEWHTSEDSWRQLQQPLTTIDPDIDSGIGLSLSFHCSIVSSTASTSTMLPILTSFFWIVSIVSLLYCFIYGQYVDTVTNFDFIKKVPFGPSG